MKSFFTKLGGFLLCAVMLTTVGCHDYAEDIRDLDNKVTADLDSVKGDLESKLDEAVAGLNDKLAELYATKEMLNKVETDLNALIAANATEITKNAGDIIKNGDDIKANAAAIDAIKKNATESQKKLDETIAALQKADADNEKAITDAIELAASDLKVAIEKVNQSITDLQEGKVDVSVFQEAVTGFNKSIDELQKGLVKANAAIAENAANITKIFGQIAELTGKVSTNTTDIATIKGQIETINGQIDNIKTDIQDLKDSKADKSVVEAVEARVAALEAARTALEERCTNLENNKADKTVVEALSSSVDALAARVDALENGLKEANGLIANNAADIKDIQAALTTLATKAELEAAVQALNATIETLASKSDLEIAIAALEASTSKNLDDAKAELKAAYEAADKAIADRVSAIEASYASKTDLEAAKTAVSEAYAKADADLKTELLGEISKVNTALTAEIERLENLIKGLRVDVDALIARIQKIVYKPTHADGKARLNYAKLGEETLEGYSTLTYRVYPAEYADSIAKSFAAGASFITYDLIPVTKGETDATLDIEGVEATEDGLLSVKVRPNGLGESFYTSESNISWSAALVLANKNDYFSSEYTNLVADASASKNIEMVLYLGDKPYDYSPVKHEWPFVATGDTWKVTLLDGLNARFEYNNEIHTTTTLKNKYGYEVAYTREISYKSREENQKSMVITKPENNDFTSYVTVCPPADGEKVNVSYMKDYLEVTYTFACADSELSGSATVGIVDFPYTLQVNSKPLDKAYEIPYVDDQTSHVVLENMIDVLYHDANGNGILRSEIEKMFPALNPKFGVELTGFNAKDEADKTVVDLFEVTGDSYAVTVALKKGENGLLAKKENVGSVMNVKYTFDVPVLKREVQSVSADVKITEATSSFPLGTFNAVWTYMEDVYAGAYNNPATRTFVLSPVADSNGAVYKELPFANPTSLVVKKGEETVNNVTVEFAAEGVTVTGFEWNASYSVEAKYNVEIDGIVASIATVVFDFTTAKPELPVFTLTFSNSDMYAANMVKSYDHSLAGLWQLDATYQGAGFVEANWLKDVLVDNAYTVVNTVKYTENNEDKTEVTVNPEENQTANNLVISADASTIATTYDYKGYTTVPTAYAYTKEIVTYYGQKIVINATLDFTLPSADYRIRHNIVWVKDNNSLVNPLWEETNGKVSGFNVDQVKLREAFIVTKNGQDLSVEEVAAENLDWKFYLELDDVEEGTLVPTMNDLYEITYISPLPEVGVDCKLFLVNTVDGVEQSRVELDTNFDDDYANYVVKKYDPLQTLNFTANPIPVQLDGPDTYIVNLAQNLNITDKLDRVFIKDGDIFADNYIYDTNYFGLKLNFGAIKENLGDFAKYIVAEPVTDMSGNVIDCVVKFNYDNKMNVREDAVVTIPVTYTYFWGELTDEIQVVFKKPVVKE